VSCLQNPAGSYPLGSPRGVDLSLGPLYPNSAVELAEYECVLNAHGSCIAADQCFLGGGGATSCDPTKEDPLSAASCDGNVETACFADGIPFRHDCAIGGGICRGFGEPCLPAECADAGNSFCSGTVAVKCPEFADCAPQGATCVGPQPGRPFADCLYPSCDAGMTTSFTCNGTVMEACTPRGQSHFDCATQREFKRCVAGGCAPTGTECVTLADDCVDGGVQVCLDGFVRNFNCSAMGFPHCVVDAGCAL
jgi:hypothetical protein